LDHIRIDYDEFLILRQQLVEQISLDVHYDGILCPLRGGFCISNFISRRLGLPMIYLDISSYNGTTQGEFSIASIPQLNGNRYLLCDDIYDTGSTLRVINSLYPGVELHPYVLVSKSRDAAVTYSRLIDPDKWVDFFWEDS
jgi:hypoxanthine phosphoribosyltransferase